MGKILYRKLLYITPTILFNTLELVLLAGIGALLGLPVWQILTIILVFMLVRNIVGEGKHYKNPFLCLIWSSLVFTALFISARLNFTLAVVLTTFYATAQTGKVDVRDAFMWRSSNGEYQYLQEFITKMQGTEALITFEDKLKFVNPKVYKVYKYKFIDGYSFKAISNLMQIDTRRISEMLKTLETTMNVYFNIKL